MSAKTLAEFYEFYQLEPWGFDLADESVARVSHTVAAFSGRMKDSTRLDDFRHPSRRVNDDG